MPTTRLIGRNFLRKVEFRQKTAMLFGLSLYASEAVASIFLIPFYADAFGSSDAVFWVSLQSSVALVAVAISGYFQPYIRNISRSTSETRYSLLDLKKSISAFGKLKNIGIAILVAGLIGYAIFLLRGSAGRALHYAAVLLFFYAGLLLRLLLFSYFAWFNGMRLIGLDKLIQLMLSVLNLISLIVIINAQLGIIAAAISYFILNGAAYVAARLFFFSAFRCIDGGSVVIRSPSLKEVSRLTFLSFAGFLNINTDIIVAKQLLDPSEFLSYSLISRCLLAGISVFGLWFQIRFPFWSMSPLKLKALGAEVLRVAIVVPGSIFIMLAVLILFERRFDVANFSLPSFTIVFAMALNAGVAIIVMMLGQILVAKNEYDFAINSAYVAMLSPLIAVAIGRYFGGVSFVLGYLICNAGLLIIATIYFLRAYEKDASY